MVLWSRKTGRCVVAVSFMVTSVFVACADKQTGTDDSTRRMPAGDDETATDAGPDAGVFCLEGRGPVLSYAFAFAVIRAGDEVQSIPDLAPLLPDLTLLPSIPASVRAVGLGDVRRVHRAGIFMGVNGGSSPMIERTCRLMRTRQPETEASMGSWYPRMS